MSSSVHVCTATSLNSCSRTKKACRLRQGNWNDCQTRRQPTGVSCLANLNSVCSAWNLEHRDNNFLAIAWFTTQAGYFSGFWASYPPLEKNRSCMRKNSPIAFEFACSKVVQLRECRRCAASREKRPKTSNAYEAIYILQSATAWLSNRNVIGAVRHAVLTARPVKWSSSSCPDFSSTVMQTCAVLLSTEQIVGQTVLVKLQGWYPCPVKLFFLITPNLV